MDRVNSVYLMVNAEKEHALQHAQNVANFLHENKVKVLTEWRYHDLFYADFWSENNRDLFERCDLVMVIGGDGTILNSAKNAVPYGKTVLGINAGTLGFLASVEPDEWQRLHRVIEGDYLVDERMMLEITISGEKKYYAFNEVVVSKGALSRMIEVTVSCKDTLVNRFRADGIIVATPTGSTAYAMSAGGPVADPALKCILLTPICPHSLLSRTTIFSENKVLQIQVNSENCNHTAYVTVDGQEIIEISDDQNLEIRRSPYCVRLATFEDKAFYEVLNDKILAKDRTGKHED